jgi:hypothetical protein
LQHILNGSAEKRGQDGGVQGLLIDYNLSQPNDVAGLKGQFQYGEVVYGNSETPDIRFEGIPVIFDDFWRQIVGGADSGVVLFGGFDQFGSAQIADLNGISCTLTSKF